MTTKYSVTWNGEEMGEFTADSERAAIEAAILEGGGGVEPHEVDGIIERDTFEVAAVNPVMTTNLRTGTLSMKKGQDTPVRQLPDGTVEYFLVGTVQARTGDGWVPVPEELVDQVTWAD